MHSTCRTLAPLLVVITSALFLFTPTLNADAIYTFSRTGTDPYSFSFTLPAILTSTTPNLGVTPFAAGGFVFNDSALGVGVSSFCFAFAAGNVTDAVATEDDGCGLRRIGSIGSASGLIAVFTNANAPGTYFPFTGQALPGGSARTLTQLVIEDNTFAVPEAASLQLIGAGIIGLIAPWCVRRRSLLQ